MVMHTFTLLVCMSLFLQRSQNLEHFRRDRSGCPSSNLVACMQQFWRPNSSFLLYKDWHRAYLNKNR